MGLRPPLPVPPVLARGCGTWDLFEGGWRSSAAAGEALTTLTDTEGEPAGTMPAVLPRRDSMSSFCCCLMVSMERICSSAAASSRGMGRPMTTGEMAWLVLGSVEVEGGGLTSVLMGCEMPLIVTRRFLLGEGREAEGAGAGEVAAAVAIAAAEAASGSCWEACGGSRSPCAGVGAAREVGDGRTSYSVSSFILTLFGERRSLQGGGGLGDAREKE